MNNYTWTYGPKTNDQVQLLMMHCTFKGYSQNVIAEVPSLSTLVGLVNQQCTLGLGLMATSVRARKRDGMVVPRAHDACRWVHHLHYLCLFIGGYNVWSCDQSLGFLKVAIPVF